MKKNVLPIVAAAMALTFAACQPTDRVDPAVTATDTDELVKTVVNFLVAPDNASTSIGITLANARPCPASPSPAQIKAAFDAFDADKSGQVSATELLQAVLVKGGVPVNLDQCMQLIRMFDSNNSGMMEFNEFERLISEAFKPKKVK